MAEDSTLGVRLSSNGAVATVAYDPEVVTKEETPATFVPSSNSEHDGTRGFFQVLRKGEWRALPGARPTVSARYTLLMPFFQAFTAVAVPVSAVFVFVVKVPEAIAMITFLPGIVLWSHSVSARRAEGLLCRLPNRSSHPRLLPGGARAHFPSSGRWPLLQLGPWAVNSEATTAGRRPSTSAITPSHRVPIVARLDDRNRGIPCSPTSIEGSRPGISMWDVYWTVVRTSTYRFSHDPSPCSRRTFLSGVGGSHRRSAIARAFCWW